MKKIITLSLLFLFTSPVFATHLKGGNIQISSVAGKPLTYDFTVTLYGDNSPAGIRPWIDQKDVLICFGDGMSKNASRINGNGQGEDLGNGIAKGIYRITYTYASLISFYRVGVSVLNRNANLINLISSQQFSFYVETLFNPNFVNTTPVLTNDIGLINAKVKQKFTYNPKVIDADGDSLAYRLTIVRSSDYSNCFGGISTSAFIQPNELKKEGTFKIDIKTGDLVWSTPTEIGVYVCAFIVEEWRKGVKISETVRDMEINVKDGDGTVTPIPPYEPASSSLPKGFFTLGNEEEYENQNFVVYPNPTTEKLTAKIITDKPEKATFQLFDILGKLLEEHFQDNLSTEHVQEFDLQNVSEGILFVKIKSGNQTLTKKVVKR